ncbi:MAG: choice-of-anchor N protein [Candidatus Geothermincolia bacterium]
MKRLIGVVASLMIVLLSTGTAHAIPSLQLDIAGGAYNPKSTDPSYDSNHNAETIVGPAVAPGEAITVYAYLYPDGENKGGNTTPLNDYYYLAVAVTPNPGQSTPAPDRGSIVINGVNIPVTGLMTYGVPPYDAFMGQDHDPQDLSTHEVYETYYLQLQFTFGTPDPTTGEPTYQTSQAYNTQDNPGQGPLPGTDMYYKAFTVDTTGLTEGSFIHFDLYNSLTIPVTTEVQGSCVETYANGPKEGQCIRYDTVTLAGNDIDVNSFAPYSHDAESGGHTPVPEPSTMLLLGSGLLGLGFLRRRRNS